MKTNKSVLKNKIPRRAVRGLTLIEILVVVAILGLIASVVGVTAGSMFEEAKVDTAKQQIHNFGSALDLYRVKIGKYPNSAEGLPSLTNPPKGKKPLLESIPKDPWDADYIYVYPGQRVKGKYDLYSKGPDGVADNEDDVTNWKK